MSPRSTAGVGLDPFRWLGQVAGEHTGAVFCVAAAIAANPVRGTGLYGAPRDQLGRLAGVDAHNRVDPSVRTLTGDGFLELARPGGGRGIFRLFQLAQPALISTAETSRWERLVSHTKPAVEDGWFDSETSRGERPDSAIPAVDNGWFLPALSYTARAEGEGEGEGDPLPPNPAIAEVVARLPVRLHARTAKGRAAMGDVVGRLLAAGWCAEDLLTVACEPLPLEPITAPWAFLERRFKGRPAPMRFTVHHGGTPTPAAFVAPDMSAALPPAEQAARAKRLREQLRGAS